MLDEFHRQKNRAATTFATAKVAMPGQTSVYPASSGPALRGAGRAGIISFSMLFVYTYAFIFSYRGYWPRQS